LEDFLDLSQKFPFKNCHSIKDEILNHPFPNLITNLPPTFSE